MYLKVLLWTIKGADVLMEMLFFVKDWLYTRKEVM
jgi:hypothetical protein